MEAIEADQFILGPNFPGCSSEDDFVAASLPLLHEAPTPPVNNPNFWTLTTTSGSPWTVTVRDPIPAPPPLIRQKSMFVKEVGLVGRLPSTPTLYKKIHIGKVGNLLSTTRMESLAKNQMNPFNVSGKNANEVLKILRVRFKEGKNGDDLEDRDKTIAQCEEDYYPFGVSTLRAKCLPVDPPDGSLYINKGTPRIAHKDSTNVLMLALELKREQIKLKLKAETIEKKRRQNAVKLTQHYGIDADQNEITEITNETYKATPATRKRIKKRYSIRKIKVADAAKKHKMKINPATPVEKKRKIEKKGGVKFVNDTSDPAEVQERLEEFEAHEQSDCSTELDNEDRATVLQSTFRRESKTDLDVTTILAHDTLRQAKSGSLKVKIQIKKEFKKEPGHSKSILEHILENQAYLGSSKLPLQHGKSTSFVSITSSNMAMANMDDHLSSSVAGKVNESEFSKIVKPESNYKQDINKVLQNIKKEIQ